MCYLYFIQIRVQRVSEQGKALEISTCSDIHVVPLINEASWSLVINHSPLMARRSRRSFYVLGLECGHVFIMIFYFPSVATKSFVTVYSSLFHARSLEKANCGSGFSLTPEWKANAMEWAPRPRAAILYASDFPLPFSCHSYFSSIKTWHCEAPSQLPLSVFPLLHA